MTGIFAIIDDKHIPAHRILWVADVPHFCGAEDCTAEGRYEIRLDAEESVFGTREERDDTLKTLARWQRGATEDDERWPES